MRKRSKTVYRDNESGRLITPYDARNRDPSTWTKEVIVVIDPKDEPQQLHRDQPVVEHLEEGIAGLRQRRVLR